MGKINRNTFREMKDLREWFKKEGVEVKRFPDNEEFWIDYEDFIKYAERYATVKVTSALQEAAKIQDHLRSEHFDNPDEDEIVYNAILSLIPKEK